MSLGKLAVILALVAPLHAANFAFVQGRSATSAYSLAFNASNTAGNAIWALLASGTGTHTATDTQGDTFACTSGFSITDYTVCVASNVSGGMNTVTFTGSGGNTAVIIAEYSSSSPYLWAYTAQGTANPVTNTFSSSSEVLAVFGTFYLFGCPGVSVASGTIRETACEAGSQVVTLVDDDRATITGSYSNTVTPGSAWFLGFFTIGSPASGLTQLFPITLQ